MSASYPTPSYKPTHTTVSNLADTAARDTRPAYLLDCLIFDLKLKNDAHLSRVLEVAPPVISKIRHGVLPFGATLVIRAHELSGKPIRDIKAALGQPSLRQL